MLMRIITVIDYADPNGLMMSRIWLYLARRYNPEVRITVFTSPRDPWAAVCPVAPLGRSQTAPRSCISLDFPLRHWYRPPPWAGLGQPLPCTGPSLVSQPPFPVPPLARRPASRFPASYFVSPRTGGCGRAGEWRIASSWAPRVRRSSTRSPDPDAGRPRRRSHHSRGAKSVARSFARG